MFVQPLHVFYLTGRLREFFLCSTPNLFLRDLMVFVSLLLSARLDFDQPFIPGIIAFGLVVAYFEHLLLKLIFLVVQSCF